VVSLSRLTLLTSHRGANAPADTTTLGNDVLRIVSSRQCHTVPTSPSQ